MLRGGDQRYSPTPLSVRQTSSISHNFINMSTAVKPMADTPSVNKKEKQNPVRLTWIQFDTALDTL